MSQSDPFDFSDFGAHRREASDSVPGCPQTGGGYRSDGFDPFADGPPAAHPAPSTAETFVAPAGATATGGLSVTGPPTRLLAAALAAAAAGVALAMASVSTSTVLPAFSAWLLAGPAAIGALAWFGYADTRRRLSSVYSAPGWLSTGYWTVVAICAVGIGVSAWQIALWAGRW